VRNVILDLCGGTGAWSRPWKEAGYEVDVITLPRFDVGGVEFDDYGMSFIWQDVHYHERDTVIFSELCGILAAPPCTEFSVAKGARPYDLAKGMEAVEACMRIIWKAQKRTKLDFWALENPRGRLRLFLGKPAYTFEQWQFGETKVKATDIWGSFRPPRPTVKARPEGITAVHSKGRENSRDWGNPKPPPEYAAYISQLKGYDRRRAETRAITPAGFAQAFFKANSAAAARHGMGAIGQSEKEA
jgi:hypothetical protein